MNNLLWIAVVLIVIYIIAAFTKFVAGALLNLLWVAALILLAVWVFKKIF